MKKNKICAFFLTALIFAIFHAVNFVNNCNFSFVILQIVSAFFVGLCYNGLVLRYSSILPTFILHLLTNICGTYVVDIYNKTYIIGFCISILIYLIYAVYFYIDQKRRA